MVKLSGGEALARSLVTEGVEVVFGIPGIQTYGIVAGLRDEPGIRLISTRHEQAATYMADGYARGSGKPGVALVVPGVGLYNAASGLATAYARSSSGGKGTIPDSHPLSYGSCFSPRGERQEMNQLFDVMQSADVVIGIGARFSLGNPAGNASTLVNINLDDGELMRIQSNTIPLHGDAKATIEAMLPYLDEAGAGERPSPAEAVEAARNLIAYYDIRLKEPQYALLEAIQASIPEDAFMVWAERLLRQRGARSGLGVRRHLRNRPPQPRLGQVRRVVRCRRHARGASDGACNAASGGARVRRARDHRRAVR